MNKICHSHTLLLYVAQVYTVSVCLTMQVLSIRLKYSYGYLCLLLVGEFTQYRRVQQRLFAVQLHDLEIIIRDLNTYLSVPANILGQN
jgi:hypothetical protein